MAGPRGSYKTTQPQPRLAQGTVTSLPAAAGLSWASSMIRAQLMGYLGLRVASSMFKGALRKPAMKEELRGGKRIPQHVVPAWVPRSQLQTRVPQSKSKHARLD